MGQTVPQHARHLAVMQYQMSAHAVVVVAAVALAAVAAPVVRQGSGQHWLLASALSALRAD